MKKKARKANPSKKAKEDSSCERTDGLEHEAVYETGEARMPDRGILESGVDGRRFWNTLGRGS